MNYLNSKNLDNFLLFDKDLRTHLRNSHFDKGNGMYSILPAVVSALFLGYGLFVISERGINRISLTFLVLCLTTFFWQATWSILFQVTNPHVAIICIKFGYLLILFLPTSLYHFLVEISERPQEHRYVYFSYAVAGCLAVFLLASDLFVAGYYKYFWGYYPRAGLLHPLHVLQTVVVVTRGLYITYRQQQIATATKRVRLRLCIASLFVYFFAAVDYLCNYGVEFYPPGVAFITVSLGMIAVAVVKYDLFNPLAVAASVAHEMRTPLTNITMQMTSVKKYWPDLWAGYQVAVQHGLYKSAIEPRNFDWLSQITSDIGHEVNRSKIFIETMLASAQTEQLDSSTFKYHSVKYCIDEALRRSPLKAQEKEKVTLVVKHDFQFFGSDTLLILVLINLLKNALYALKTKAHGHISITTQISSSFFILQVTDTGAGIPKDVLPHIFEAFFTTKQTNGTGIGLTFCKRVLKSFHGNIRCDSVLDEYTTFSLEFPKQWPVAQYTSGRSHKV